MQQKYLDFEDGKEMLTKKKCYQMGLKRWLRDSKPAWSSQEPGLLNEALSQNKISFLKKKKKLYSKIKDIPRLETIFNGRTYI